MPTPNKELIIKVLAHIEDLNESDLKAEHDQDQWGLSFFRGGDWDRVFTPEGEFRAEICDTVHCAAGWACVIEGVKLQWTPATSKSNALLNPNRFVEVNASCVAPEGENPYMTISRKGAELLGLTHHQAREAFYESHDLADLYEVFARVLGWKVRGLKRRVTMYRNEFKRLKQPLPTTTAYTRLPEQRKALV